MTPFRDSQFYHSPCDHSSYGHSPYGQAPTQDPSRSGWFYSQPSYNQPTYSQPSYGQPSYSQPSYSQPSYGQPSYGSVSYGHGPYGSAPAQDPWRHGAPAPGPSYPGAPTQGPSIHGAPFQEPPGRGHQTPILDPQEFADLLRTLKPERVQPPETLLPEDTVRARLQRMTRWRASAISSTVRCEDFLDAADLFNQVAKVALAYDHFPRIVIDHNIVDFTLTTPGVGLTEVDFVIAGAIDALASEHTEADDIR